MPINLAPIAQLITPAPSPTEGARVAIQGFDSLANSARMYRQAEEERARQQLMREQMEARQEQAKKKLAFDQLNAKRNLMLQYADKQTSGLKDYTQNVRQGANPMEALTPLKSVPGLNASIGMQPGKAQFAPGANVAGVSDDAMFADMDPEQRPKRQVLSYETAFGGPQQLDLTGIQEDEIGKTVAMFRTRLQTDPYLNRGAAAQAVALAPEMVKTFGNAKDAAEALYKQYEDRVSGERQERGDRARLALSRAQLGKRDEAEDRLSARNLWQMARTYSQDAGNMLRIYKQMSLMEKDTLDKDDWEGVGWAEGRVPTEVLEFGETFGIVPGEYVDAATLNRARQKIIGEAWARFQSGAAIAVQERDELTIQAASKPGATEKQIKTAFKVFKSLVKDDLAAKASFNPAAPEVIRMNGLDPEEILSVDVYPSEPGPSPKPRRGGGSPKPKGGGVPAPVGDGSADDEIDAALGL